MFSLQTLLFIAGSPEVHPVGAQGVLDEFPVKLAAGRGGMAAEAAGNLGIGLAEKLTWMVSGMF
ncbi:MAG: hypothetical protein IIB99_06075, partial [Planctomycetes bacterium]|nr:hypothetical protein [Planctomycetota bacterium]